MFSTIDGYLIDRAQWFVRWLELSSSITCKQLIRWLLAGIPLSCAVLLLFQTLTGSLWSAVMIIAGYYYGFTSLRKESKRVRSFGVRPRAVVWRRHFRFFWGMVVVLFLVIIALDVIPALAVLKGLPFLAVLVYVTSCFLPGFLILLSEYLLCTTSLPPGEKEKWKSEKELRNAVPTTA